MSEENSPEPVEPESKLENIRNRIAATRGMLKQYPAGVKSITAPGLNTTFDRRQALAELAELELEEKQLENEYSPADSIKTFRIRGNSMR